MVDLEVCYRTSNLDDSSSPGYRFKSMGCSSGWGFEVGNYPSCNSPPLVGSLLVVTHRIGR